MVGIDYHIGQTGSEKLLMSIIEAVNKGNVKLMDIEIRAIKIVKVDFKCYECGYESTQIKFSGDEISSICDECWNKNEQYSNMTIIKIKEVGR